MIPDPDAPHMRAIDPKTGRLAAGVFLIDTTTLADPTAPTVAELQAAARPELHIGYATLPPYLNRHQEDPQP